MVETAQLLAGVATQSLMDEVLLSPKPGLVDPYSSGAHDDMDLDTFAASIAALSPFFPEYVRLGAQPGGTNLVYRRVRKTGLAAESAMLRATGGVNTHKGINFTLGFLLAGLGRLMNRFTLEALVCQNFSSLFPLVASLCSDVGEDFRNLQKDGPLTYGQRLYLTNGVKGVRGEVMAGCPTLRTCVLPCLCAPAVHDDVFYLRLMLRLMMVLEDSNLLHRAGTAGLAWVRHRARELQKVGDGDLPQALRTMDEDMVQRHLSPGGTADFLALGYFFEHLRASVIGHGASLG